jgi:hypothetical protein
MLRPRCSNNSFQQNNEENARKVAKAKPKNDLKNLPPLIPKPLPDWVSAHANGTPLMNGNHSSEGTNSAQSNADVIEVDPWACSINEPNGNDDSDLQPTQSKLRKLLSEHPVSYRVLQACT